MGLFSFAESPQLQALLADVVPTGVRDVAFALYFTLAFGVGSLWTAVYGAIIEAAGEATGLPIVFGLMAASFVAAAVIMLPVRDPPRRAPAAAVADAEAAADVAGARASAIIRGPCQTGPRSGRSAAW